MKVVITEFMDQPAVDALRKQFDVIYDPNCAGSCSKISYVN